MCLNPDCQEYSLICEDSDCSMCMGEDGEAHADCSFVLLKAITSQLNKRAEKQKSFVKNIIEIDNRFVNQLQRSRQALAQKCGYGNLEEK